MTEVATAFDWAAVRRLSHVDVDPRASNQHEVAAGSLYRHLLATGGIDRRDTEVRIGATWLVLRDDEDPIVADESVQLYDARRNNPQRRPEWRLYYAHGGLVESILHQHVRPGDLVVYATPLATSPELVMMIAPADSQWEQALLNLFPIDGVQMQLTVVGSAELARSQSRASARLIADLLDLSVHTTSDVDWLAGELGDLTTVPFPDTRTMATLAEKRLGPWDGTDPDGRLVELLDTETRLFHALENVQVLPRFRDDCATTDDYLTLAKSLLQRRRSRRGYSFEIHMASVLRDQGLVFETQAETEPSSRVDFLFPSLEAYVVGRAPLDQRVAHMNAKSTSRERWKQVLSEAQKLNQRHLGTLDPGLSPGTIAAALEAGVRVVMPESIRDLYAEEQGQYLWSIADFVEHIAEMQGRE